MKKRILCLLPAVLLGILICGCSGAAPEATDKVTEPTQASAATAAAETAAPAAEETFPATQASPEATAPAETQASDPRMPVMELPTAAEGPCSFFDDAAFIGDSISYSLMVHNAKTHDLGEAQFLVRGSLGIHNSLSIQYRGSSLKPWEALQECGAKKVFILLGMNDIGYYSIEETITLWGTFLDNIRQACPDVQIYIQSLTPMWTGAQQKLLNNENIDRYNTQLKAMAETYGCHYVDLAPYFKDNTNGMCAEYCGDLYVHMNEKGTAAWATILKAYAESLT